MGGQKNEEGELSLVKTSVPSSSSPGLSVHHFSVENLLFPYLSLFVFFLFFVVAAPCPLPPALLPPPALLALFGRGAKRLRQEYGGQKNKGGETN
jgi:hypothetical protein